jgi:hypothetical protein
VGPARRSACCDLPAGQVKGEQDGVAVAGDKRQSAGRVQASPWPCRQSGNGTRRGIVRMAGSMTAQTWS